MPEDILHDRREQSLMQIEGASMARNSVSSQRGILSRIFLTFRLQIRTVFLLKRNYVT